MVQIKFTLGYQTLLKVDCHISGLCKNVQCHCFLIVLQKLHSVYRYYLDYILKKAFCLTKFGIFL